MHACELTALNSQTLSSFMILNLKVWIIIIEIAENVGMHLAKEYTNY